MSVARWGAVHTAAHLSTPGPDADKYRRGVLGLRTGSAAYPGAAVLGAEAAWRTGLGLLRYVPPLGDAEPSFGLPTPAAAVLAARPETVFASDARSALRCDAWLVGSGTDSLRRSFADDEAIHRLLAGDAPVVLDAGALGLLLDRAPTAPTIATPHRGEFLQLWRQAGLGELPGGWPSGRDEAPTEAGLRDAASALAARLGATVLLKGSLTIAATPGGFSAACGPATPWLATAGTGDVLAGILGALAATHSAEVREDPELLGRLGASAAVLHDTAARLAAGCGVLAGDWLGCGGFDCDCDRLNDGNSSRDGTDSSDNGSNRLSDNSDNSDRLSDSNGKPDFGPGGTPCRGCSPDPALTCTAETGYRDRPITALDVAHALPAAVAALRAAAPQR